MSDIHHQVINTLLGRRTTRDIMHKFANYVRREYHIGSCSHRSTYLPFSEYIIVPSSTSETGVASLEINIASMLCTLAVGVGMAMLSRIWLYANARGAVLIRRDLSLADTDLVRSSDGSTTPRMRRTRGRISGTQARITATLGSSPLHMTVCMIAYGVSRKSPELRLESVPSRMILITQVLHTHVSA